MYKKGTTKDKQRKDAGNQMLCPYRNFSEAIITYTDRVTLLLNSKHITWQAKGLSEKNPLFLKYDLLAEFETSVFRGNEISTLFCR